MRFSIVPLFIFAMPLVEIAGFIIVGKAIGLWATLGLVILSIFAGLALLRIQGIGILQRISAESRNGGVPGRDLVHGAMIVLAALLLLLPGFVSDILGLLLFIPAVRDLAWKYLSQRIIILGSAGPFARGNNARPSGTRNAPVVDLDEKDYHREPNRKSPWSDQKRLED
ncbi:MULTISPECIES: FxsA family protein [unclassified Sinorhizobium]|uniref:FxsA family protein n=1 Tax=unclassified Sinorhizobium TaxID=2613772 RepID=UPI0035259C05